MLARRIGIQHRANVGETCGLYARIAARRLQLGGDENASAASWNGEAAEFQERGAG